MKFSVIVADCPFSFSDKLVMSDVKRGSQSNYSVMSMEELKGLDIKSITEDNSVLAFWCPSALLVDGLDIMKAWGFECKQTWIWVKTKNNPFVNLIKNLLKANNLKEMLNTIFGTFDINSILAFGMGRIFRQSHEIVLVGTKGKANSLLKNKSQRSVFLGPNEGHSKKPEALQDRLDIMYPGLEKIELFARRERKGWTCVGNELALKEDIRDSIKRLVSI